MPIELQPGDGQSPDTERIWHALEQAKASRDRRVYLHPGKYIVDNTITVDKVMLHGPIPHPSARRDWNDGFPWLCPRISDGPDYQPVIQIRNGGHVENLRIEWEDSWQKRGVGIQAAESCTIKSIKLFGAINGIQTGYAFLDGYKNCSRMTIDDCFILHTTGHAISMSRCFEWSEVTNTLVKYCKVGIDLLDNATDIEFKNVKLLAGDAHWQQIHGAHPAVDVKAGDNPTHFCTVEFNDCHFDMFAHVLRIADNAVGDASHEVRYRNGWAKVHHDGVLYNAAGAKLFVTGVDWKGNTGFGIRLGGGTNKNSIQLSQNLFNFPGGTWS